MLLPRFPLVFDAFRLPELFRPLEYFHQIREQDRLTLILHQTLQVRSHEIEMAGAVPFPVMLDGVEFAIHRKHRSF